MIIISLFIVNENMFSIVDCSFLLSLQFKSFAMAWIHDYYGWMDIMESVFDHQPESLCPVFTAL